MEVDADEFRDRWRGAAAWLDASPSEVVALVVLALGAVAAVGVLWWSGGAVPVSPPPTDLTAAPTEVTGGDVATVHVAGAVGRPGLVEVPVGARVADALQAAGGVALDAETSSLNLAREVVDGERIDVPRLGEAQAGGAGPDGNGGTGSGAVGPDGTVNLNLASAAELETLPGIGPVLSQRIIAHREANGPFAEVGGLRAVAGIGEKRFQALVDLLTV